MIDWPLISTKPRHQCYEVHCEQLSALSFSQTLFLLCKCLVTVVVSRSRRKTAVGKMSLNFGFKSSGLKVMLLTDGYNYMYLERNAAAE